MSEASSPPSPPPPFYSLPMELEITLNPGISAADVGNAVYKLASAIFETYGQSDPTSGIRGHGHHIAQLLVTFAEKAWKERGGKESRAVVDPVALGRDVPAHRTQHTYTIHLRPGMWATDIEVATYAICIKIFEVYGEGDPDSGFQGHGHHCAQQVALYARNLWLLRGGRPDPVNEVRE